MFFCFFLPNQHIILPKILQILGYIDCKVFMVDCEVLFWIEKSPSSLHQTLCFHCSIIMPWTGKSHLYFHICFGLVISLIKPHAAEYIGLRSPMHLYMDMLILCVHCSVSFYHNALPSTFGLRSPMHLCMDLLSLCFLNVSLQCLAGFKIEIACNG